MTVCGPPQASQGAVFFEDENITAENTHLIMRRGIAISPEGRRIFPDMTVADNLKMGGFFLSKAQTQSGLEHVYGLFPRLRGRANTRAGTMSGGEQQLLAIDCVLMTIPQLSPRGRAERKVGVRQGG